MSEPRELYVRDACEEYFDHVNTVPFKNCTLMIEKSAYDKLQTEVFNLNGEVSYYKREFENACERVDYRDEIIEEQQEKIEKLVKSIDKMANDIKNIYIFKD